MLCPAPGHKDNFWALACFPLILLCCLRIIRTTRRFSIQNLESTNWENIQPHTDRWLSCPSTLVSSVTVKNWPKFFFLWNAKITLMWKLFLFSIYFCLFCCFSRKKQKSSVREKCRKLELLMRVWLCVCDQVQCRIVMLSDSVGLNNNNNYK